MTDRILLSHGGGGRATRDLIRKELHTRFELGDLPDAASLATEGASLLFTTDSFVVQPLEFPGGNIGTLAVCGTVNDLSVSGGRPRYLSCGLILEEGLELSLLRRVLDSMRETAAACGVAVVTGDTKVVPRGQCDGIYINTAGIGFRLPGFSLSAATLQQGDEIIVSGPLAEHGLAILAARKGAPLTTPLASDVAPVHRLIEALTPLAPQIRFMRDPTRGGLAMLTHDLVEGQPFGIQIDEGAIPKRAASSAFAEITGIDIFHLASEGRVVTVCARGCAGQVLEAWQALPEGKEAARIGAVTGEAGRVVLQTVSGGRRLLDIPEGELLPRIC